MATYSLGSLLGEGDQTGGVTLTSPSQVVLDWVARSLGATAVGWSRQLAGGTHAVTDVVRTVDGQELVLRQFPPGDDAVHRESRVLDALDGFGGLAPQLLAADPDGAQVGRPAILTTLLPGQACIAPDDPQAFAGQLGRVLARLHAHASGSRLPDVLTAPAAARDPTAADLLDAWARLCAAPRVLTHYDFWSGNTLWRDGRLSGVVDWSGAGLAPRGFDLSWARLDLFLLFDRAIADAFTCAYEAEVGFAVSDLGLWDLYASTNARPGIAGWAPNYQGLGRTDLGPARLHQRLTEWTLTASRHR